MEKIMLEKTIFYSWYKKANSQFLVLDQIKVKRIKLNKHKGLAS